MHQSDLEYISSMNIIAMYPQVTALYSQVVHPYVTQGDLRNQSTDTALSGYLLRPKYDEISVCAKLLALPPKTIQSPAVAPKTCYCEKKYVINQIFNTTTKNYSVPGNGAKNLLD